MRHAQRANLRNYAVATACLCAALGGGAYLALRDRTPEIITVVEYRDLPGETCAGIDVAAPVPGIPAVLDRILRRAHRPRNPAAVAHEGSIPALPPLTCAPPEGPVTRRENSGDVHTVPEPATIALMALAVPFAMRRRG